MEDLVQCFVDEALENLECFSRTLVRLELLLERGSDLAEEVDGLFRCIHTIKGAAGFLAFAGIERVSHAGEDVLALMRAGELDLSAPLVSTLLSMVDALTGYVADISTSGAESARDDSALLAALTAATDAPGEHRVGPAAHRPSPGRPESEAEAAEAAMTNVARAHVASSVRVGVETIDNLVRLIGELVTCRNELRQLAAKSGDLQMLRQVQQLAQLTGGLRDGVMNARLQPVGTVWQSLPKLARDIAVRSGKQVSVTTYGADIELDRNVLDAVRDPLVHMVRNAVDHGIETREARLALGKSASGALALRAEYTAGNVLIELSDDGRGIDPAAISRRAVELGLVTPREAAGMTDLDLVRLVLRPGFSTAGSVTNVSGRGVGMDVVRTDVERVGGSIDLLSVPGQGTTVRLEVPRSVAITDVLTVRVAGHRLALPQTQVVELVRVVGAKDHGSVEPSQEGPVLRWRGTVLPLVDLVALLGLTPTAEDDAPDLTVVVARAGAGNIALSVDGLLDTEEVVVRPMGRHLDHLGLYSGSAVLPDGGVTLLLDVPGVVRESKRAPAPVAVQEEFGEGGTGRALDFLTVDVGDGRQLAIPLEMVVRLLEVETDTIEQVGSWETLHIDDQVLPLVRVPAPLASADADHPGSRTKIVVVRTSHAQDVGFVVRAVGDIAAATALSALEEPGLDGVAVLRGRVTGQLDARAAALEVLEQLEQFQQLEHGEADPVEHFVTAGSR